MNWNIVALFLAGTVVGVLSQCQEDTHCVPADTQCCVANTMDQLVGQGSCKQLARFGQPCGIKSTEFKKNFYNCGCNPATLECRVDPRYANSPNNHRYMKCYPKAADITDDDTDDDKEPGEQPKEDDTEVNKGPGGEPPRDDDCEDWEKPC